MQTFKWSFRPGLAASLAALITVLVLAGLGLWQLQRADEKQVIFESYQARRDSTPLELNGQTNATSVEQIQWRKASLHGSYLNGTILLLDNQLHNGEAGYHVFSVLDTGPHNPLVVVNRGWIAAGQYRNEVPAIAGSTEQVNLTGVVTAFPSAPGISTGPEAPPELMNPGVYRMQGISRVTVEKLFGRQVATYMLRLDQESATGFTRVWPEPGSGRERHLGYAFQWFSMAVVLVIIYIRLNLKRRNSNEP